MIVLQRTEVVEFPHGFAWLDYKDLRSRVAPFEDALALMMSPAHLGSASQTPDRTWIEYVSGNYFTLPGVPAVLGRTWSAGEGEKPGADPLVDWHIITGGASSAGTRPSSAAASR